MISYGSLLLIATAMNDDTNLCKFCNLVEPSIEELRRIVVPEVKAHWKDLAYSMGYEIAAVKGIDSDGRNVGDRCIGLFEDWLEFPRSCTPKTWKTLIERIRNVDELYAAADRIQKKLLGDK